MTHDATGAQIRQLRKARGLSGPKLAAAADTTHGHLYSIERGRKGASDALRRRIANALAVPLAAIAGDTGAFETTLREITHQVQPATTAPAA